MCLSRFLPGPGGPGGPRGPRGPATKHLARTGYLLWFFFLSTLPILSGCTTATTYKRSALLASIKAGGPVIADPGIGGGASLIEGVPVLKQRSRMCGPTALAMVLGYYGYDVSAEEIATEVFSEKLKGTLSIDMLLYAKRMGLGAEFYSVASKGGGGSGIADLKKRVEDKTPPIVFMDVGYWFYPVWHYAVITGYSDELKVVVAHAGKADPELIGFDKLLKAWGKTGFSTLMVTPAGGERV